MLHSMNGVYGCVNFSLLVYVPVRDAALPDRPKRVKLATVWCEYVDRHAVVAEFKKANGHRLFMAGDLQAEFVLREGIDCEPDHA